MRLRPPLGAECTVDAAEKRVGAAQAVLFTKVVHTGRAVVKIGSTARFEAASASSSTVGHLSRMAALSRRWKPWPKKRGCRCRRCSAA